MAEVLFVCVHNPGRSQMAAALLDSRSQGRVRVRSAGSAPASTINPTVVKAMDEIGLDLSKEFPKPLTDELARTAGFIHVTDELLVASVNVDVTEEGTFLVSEEAGDRSVFLSRDDDIEN